jgi:surface antigen
MKQFSKTCICIGLALSLVGCAGVSNQDAGVVTGGLVGGAVGSLFGSGSGRIVAAVGGTVLGAVIGGAIGHNMDKTDQMQVNNSLNNLPSGQSQSWQNPDTGNQYTVTPVKTYYQHKRPCREFITYAQINGRTQKIHGRACRASNGTWRMVNR